MSKLRNHFNTFSNLVNTKHKICNLSVYSGVLNMSKPSEQRRVRLPATQTTAESREQLTEAGWKSNWGFLFKSFKSINVSDSTLAERIELLNREMKKVMTTNQRSRIRLSFISFFSYLSHKWFPLIVNVHTEDKDRVWVCLGRAGTGPIHGGPHHDRTLDVSHSGLEQDLWEDPFSPVDCEVWPLWIDLFRHIPRRPDLMGSELFGDHFVFFWASQSSLCVGPRCCPGCYRCE